MPEVGEYWYCADGSAEVVRILAVDDEICTYVLVNSFVRPPFGIHDNRLNEQALDDFLDDYEPHPNISDEWLAQGSIWFARQDINSRVVVEEALEDDTVSFREIHSGGVGAVQRMTRQAFTELYVLTDEDEHDHLSDERFWVMGGGICAVFISRDDAQAFIYETCALLRLPESSLEIYVGPRRAVPRGTPSPQRTVILDDVPHNPPEPQPQTLWERLSASDD